jgi:hypothetical protein
MNAPETKSSIVEHGRVEAELRRLVVGQVTSLWGHTVWRQSLHHWQVDNDAEPRLLLRAIDILMSRFGSLETLCYDASDERHESRVEGNRRQPEAG